MLWRVSFFATPWTATCQASLSFTIFQSLLKLMSNESVMPSNHLVLCRPLLLLPSIFLSIRVFSNMLAVCIRWQKYWSFSLSISPSNEYSRLISLRIDWFDLLADQGTLKSLLQHHSSKASVLQHSVYFIVQLSHVYMTTGKVRFDYTDLGRQREREWVPISTNSRQCVCVRTEPCSGGRHFSSPETLSGNSRLASMFPKFKWPAVRSLRRSNPTQSERGHSSGAVPRRKDKWWFIESQCQHLWPDLPLY